MTEALHILEARQGRCMAVWHEVVLVFGATSLNAEALARLDEVLHERLAVHPAGVAVLRWVPAGSPGPSDETRQQVIEMFARLGDRLLGFATVLEGSGFWASGARSVLTDIARRSGFTAPLAVLDELDEAVQWVLQRVGEPQRLGSLRMAVARLKTRLAQVNDPRS